MTIANASNSNLFLGNGATSVFSFTFVADAAQYLFVTYTDSSGNETVLTPSQYSLFINPAASDAIWGVGGTVTYPISGTPIATGTSLLIERILPITQLTSIEDQGNFDPQVIESALDTQCMEIQQLSNSVTRSIQIPAVDPASINVILPAAAVRANQALLFDSSGNVIVGGVTDGSVVISAAMIPVVEAATITEAANLLGVSPSTYIATTVGGTANAIVVTATYPSNFQLVDGVLITATPPLFNTGSTTLAVETTGVPFTIYKVGGEGLIPLQDEDLGGFPVIFQFSTNINGLGTSGWIGLTILLSGRTTVLNTNYTTSAADLFQVLISGAAINFTLPASSATFPYFYEDLNSLGGTITIIPHTTDRINGINANFVMPKGGSGRLVTDANGNWYINFLSAPATNNGGMVNKIRNNACRVAQRGTNGTISSGTNGYTLDGHIVGCAGAGAAWSQGSITLPTGAAGNVLSIATAVGMTDLFWGQRIESNDIAPYAGVQVTFQALVSQNTGVTITPKLTVTHPTAVDNWASTVTDVNAVSLQSVISGTDTVVSYSFLCNIAAVNGLEVVVDFGTSANIASKVINLTNFDLRATPTTATGLVSVPPTVEYRPYQIELDWCQRYLASFGDIIGPISGGMGLATSSTNAAFVIQLPVPMRTTPSSISAASLANLSVERNDGGAGMLVTNLTLGTSDLTSNRAAYVSATVASGLTGNVLQFLVFNTASAGNLLFLGAEL